MKSPLFQRLLGDGFATLAPQVRALHSLQATETWRGEASIQRGRHPLAKLCALMTGLPPSAQHVATAVEFVITADGENWHRDFGGYPMSSRLREREGLLRERMGPIEFRFDLTARNGEIHWRTAGARLLGMLPLPAVWFTHVRCREREHGGRYEFLVEAALPWLGPLIRYEGWLGRT